MSGLQTMTLADSLRTPRVSLRAMGPALASAFFHLIDGDRSHLGATMA